MLKHRALDLAAGSMQRKYPLEAMSTYLNGFHMYADDMGRQVEATHFCIHLQHDLHQCVIFDRNAPDARLIGIEYIISEERFRALPEDGQASDEMIRARDDRLGISTSGKRENRADIPMPEVAPGANAWESGRSVQTRIEERDFSR
ncbi:DUF1264 domain-containing protein [Streptomyces tendae]|uniref:DUF1264 domain-containing protein n=1 Tax=Streptomyces tendae TaxID=1932 RepID=UPI003661AF8E